MGPFRSQKTVIINFITDRYASNLSFTGESVCFNEMFSPT